jgi:hypothetical protein
LGAGESSRRARTIRAIFANPRDKTIPERERALRLPGDADVLSQLEGVGGIGGSALALRVVAAGEPVPDLDGNSGDRNAWRDVSGNVCAWSERRGREEWLHVPRVGSYAFATGVEEVQVVPDPSAPPELVQTAYLRTVLPMALQFLGREVLHASAVLAESGVVAFCAVSTTGKSTLAAAFGGRGFPLWADDAVALERVDRVFEAPALPFEARLVPENGSTVRHPPLERAPLAAACVLERRREDARGPFVSVARLAPPEAFLSLLTHAYCYSLDDVERNRRMTERYLEAAQTLPVYRVTFNSDLERLPEVADAIQHELCLSAPALA